jgi:hypothetical protein
MIDAPGIGQARDSAGSVRKGCRAAWLRPLGASDAPFLTLPDALFRTDLRICAQVVDSATKVYALQRQGRQFSTLPAWSEGPHSGTIPTGPICPEVEGSHTQPLAFPHKTKNRNQVPA